MDKDRTSSMAGTLVLFFAFYLAAFFDDAYYPLHVRHHVIGPKPG